MGKLNGLGSLTKKQKLALAIFMEMYGINVCTESYQLIRALQKLFALGKLDQHTDSAVYRSMLQLENLIYYAELAVEQNGPQSAACDEAQEPE